MTKQCPKCEKICNNDDFYHDVCFRCKYKEKCQPVIIVVCRFCNKKLSKKGPVYCSKECKDMAKAKQIRNHWTKNIQSTHERWR